MQVISVIFSLILELPLVGFVMTSKKKSKFKTAAKTRTEESDCSKAYTQNVCYLNLENLLIKFN